MKSEKKSTSVLRFYPPSTQTQTALPLVASTVQAGFPSPSEDFIETTIDLNAELLKNPDSTFFCRVSGDSMQGVGIYDGDLLVIDKSLEVRNGKIAVCFVDGEFTLKQIKIENNHCWLMPANPKYSPLKITEENEFMVWGVVTYSIKQF